MKKTLLMAAVVLAAASPSKGAITFTAEIPLEMEMTQEEFGYFTVIDANGDNQKWRYQAQGMTSPCNDKMQSDDWSITPGLRFTDVASNYEMAFTMQQNMRGDKFASWFEFYIGTSPEPEAMTTLIGRIDNFYVAQTNTPYPQAIQFAVPGDPGTYYIGFRCVSPKLENGVSPWPCTFRNLSIKPIESSAEAPMQPSDLRVEACAQGELAANVSFTMPSQTMNGKPLAGGTLLTATIASPAETLTFTGTPGETVSRKIATLQGSNTISVKVDGELEGEPLSAEVYTGVVLPMRVHDLAYTLTPDNMSMTITWTPPTEGKDGGYVDFNDVTYGIYINNGSEGEFVELADAGSDLTYTYRMAPGERLRTVKLKVLSKNAAGVSTDDISWTDQDPVYVSDMLGTPYALPAIEKFDGQDMAYTPITILRPEGYSGKWYIGDPSECVPDENQSALIAYNPFDDDATMGRVALPKFSTKGEHNVAFTVSAMRYAGYAGAMTLYARNHDEPLTLLGTIDCSNFSDWAEVSYPLPAQFQDKDWVQFVIDVDLADVDYVYAVDSYKVAVAAGTDLAVTDLKALSALEPMKTVKFRATVANVGFNPLMPTVRFTIKDSDGRLVDSSDVPLGSLATGKEANADWSYMLTTELMDRELEVTAALIGADEVESNNSMTALFHVRKPELPTVTTLTATGTEAGIELTWDEPALHKTLTEGFETLDDFYYGERMGDFKAIDRDGKSVYKFQNVEMPNEQLPKAFMVVNAAEVDADGLDAHQGNKYLMATCPEMIGNATPDAADDWLVSPQLAPGSYVSFWINIISASYPETIRLLASDGSGNPEDFNEITSLTKKDEGWGFVETRLPTDATRFALNYISRDMFGIMVDDIKYVSAERLHTVKGYNVYRDGLLLATVNTTTYTDASLPEGQTARYHVTTLTDGESIASNYATAIGGTEGVEVSRVGLTLKAAHGGLLLEGYGEAEVVSVSGVKCFRGMVNGSIKLDLVPGVYVVVTDGRVRKLTISR